MEMYQFIKQIGHGRYSDVWLVKGAKTKKNYALKRIDFHPFHKREQRAAHLEVKLLCTVRHPNIISYLDSFHNSCGSLFVVMSYCEHGNLHSLINSRNGVLFEEKEIIKWFVQICMALKYLHDQSILHRDIKTQNLFLTRQKSVKLGDFGITRIFNAIERMSSTLLDSPCYTSPEVYSKAPFGQKCDIWSLGCCIYELAMLRYAFLLQDVFILKKERIEKNLSALCENYSLELRSILLSMLNLDSEKRPSATELLLNDYIRKHIILFLHDSPHRSDSSQSVTSEVILLADSNARSEIRPSTYSVEMSKKEDNKCEKKECFKTIPDINGNGDANDNSQQQASILEHSFDSEKKHVLHSSKSKNEKHPKVANEFRVISKISCSNGKNPQGASAKQLEKKLNSETQKLKSENSFLILNSLQHSINSLRFKSMDTFTDSNIAYRTKHNHWEVPPKSAEDIFLLSKRLNHNFDLRPATSADLNCGIIANDANGSCLPIIKESTKEKVNDRKNCCSVSLPPLSCLQDSYTPNNRGLKEDSLLNLEEPVVDKFLLKNIMECNKIKQKQTLDADISSISLNKLNNSLEMSSEVLCHKS